MLYAVAVWIQMQSNQSSQKTLEPEYTFIHALSNSVSLGPNMNSCLKSTDWPQTKAKISLLLIERCGENGRWLDAVHCYTDEKHPPPHHILAVQAQAIQWRLIDSFKCCMPRAGKIDKLIKSECWSADTMKQSEEILLFITLLLYSIRSYRQLRESLLNSTHILLFH